MSSLFKTFWVPISLPEYPMINSLANCGIPVRGCSLHLKLARVDEELTRERKDEG